MKKNASQSNNNESRIWIWPGAKFEAVGSKEKTNVFIRTEAPSGQLFVMEGGEVNLENADVGGGVEMKGGQMKSKATLHHGAEEIFSVGGKAKLKMEESTTMGKITLKDEADVTSEKSIHMPFVAEFINSHKNTLSGRITLVASGFGLIAAVFGLLSAILAFLANVLKQMGH